MSRKTPPYAEFANRLFIAQKRWELKTGRQFSREALAEAAGKSDSTISNWFLGKSLPKNEQIQKIAEVLEANPGWLAFGDQAVITGPDGEPLGFPSPSEPTHRQQGKHESK